MKLVYSDLTDSSHSLGLTAAPFIHLRLSDRSSIPHITPEFSVIISHNHPLTNAIHPIDWLLALCIPVEIPNTFRNLFPLNSPPKKDF